MLAAKEIELKADAARAPCIAYWLLVFACLMVHLFPVHDHAGQAGFRNHAVVMSPGGGDWTPPPGVSEIPILPVAGGAPPENGPAVFVPAPAREPHMQAVRRFDARGPPSFI